MNRLTENELRLMENELKSLLTHSVNFYEKAPSYIKTTYSVSSDESKDVASAMIEKLDEIFSMYKKYWWNQLITHYQIYKRLPDYIVSPELVKDCGESNYNFSEVQKEFSTLTNNKYKGKYGELYCNEWNDGPRATLNKEFFGEFFNCK
jgi:hypothetical protein